MRTALHIHEFAQPRLADYFRPTGSFRPMLTTCVGLFAHGRNAVYWAFRRLNLEPGSRVWVPLFHCGWEVQPMLDLGLDVGYYSIREDLSVDEDALMQKLEARPGAVLLIHYYGWGQPCTERLAQYCAARRMPLVEDCSHALFSRHQGRELGAFGVMGVFSLAKTIAITSGGALRVNEREYRELTGRPFEPIPPLAFSKQYYVAAAKGLVRRLMGRRMTGWVRKLRNTIPEEATTSSHLTNMGGSPGQRYRDIYQRGLSAPSTLLAGRVDVEAVVRRRRVNWKMLHEGLARWPDYQGVFPDLPEGVCPMFLPIRVRNRTELMAKLKARNIETFVFGGFAHPLMEHDERPGHHRLRENILCLPIHQGLGPAHLQYLIQTLGPLLGAHVLEADSA